MTPARRIAGVALLALGLLVPGPDLAARAETAGAAAQSELPLVTLARAERRPVVARVPVSGSLVARQEAEVHANVGGYEIIEIMAEVGDRVRAGEVLALLADAALSAQLAQVQAEYQRAQASVHQAESQIASAKAELTQADTVLVRTRSLRESGNVSQAVLELAVATEAAAQAATDSATEGLGVAQASLVAAEAAVRLARLNLSYARLVAPVDGVVVGRNAVLGANSVTGGAALFTLVARGEIEFAAEVIETALSQIQPGDSAEIEVAGLGMVAGKLRLAPASVDPVTRLGLARIELAPDARLRIGVFARGWIITDRREAVTVPASAVLADDQGERVQVVKAGLIETRPVRAGLLWQGQREILEGLEPGESVVARAGAFFRSGDHVRAAP